MGTTKHKSPSTSFTPPSTIKYIAVSKVFYAQYPLNVFPTYSLFLHPSMYRKGEGPFLRRHKREEGARRKEGFRRRELWHLLFLLRFPLFLLPYFESSFLPLPPPLTPLDTRGRAFQTQGKGKGQITTQERALFRGKGKSNISTYALPYATPKGIFLRSQKVPVE